MSSRRNLLPIKSAEEIQGVREACQIAATVLEQLCQCVASGVNTYDLDQEGRRLIEGFGAESACYQYRNGSHIYPAYTCLSVNDEVVHGIGSVNRFLQPGDNIAVDVVVRYRDFIGDNARTLIIDRGTSAMELLVKTTEEALHYSIQFAKAEKRVGAIGSAVQQYVEQRGMSVVRDFVGHGLGRSMHEQPAVPNYGRSHSGAKLYAGMTIAVEPMVNLGSPAVEIDSDGWTARTCDGQPAAHFEHTILIQEGEPEILTIPQK